VRVLLVEDDERMAGLVRQGLAQEGWTVDHAADGQQGLALALAVAYDVLVVDVMLPGLDGFGLITALRGAGRPTPVLVLSARDAVEDRVHGLQVGADDYLVKPFAMVELVARLHALARRAAPPAPEAAVLQVADLRFDVARRQVTRAGQPIILQPLELALLEYLMRHAGRVVSRTMIMEQVWHYNFDPQTNVVEARICRLRDKIDRAFGQPLIHTLRGVGYVLEARR
jgi:two-component system OmpR family response regulator